MNYKNRIIGSGTEDPQILIPNPKNFRKHPKNQNDALSGVLSDLGWIQQVIVNKTTGNVIDGHLRIELAKSQSEKSIPVLYVELSESEEALALAVLDPISAMAQTDKEKLAELLGSIESTDVDVMNFIEELAIKEGIVSPDFAPGTEDDQGRLDEKEPTICPNCGHEWVK
jgi:hypothetical protein